MSQKQKVFGIGLNKTGTKTLARHLKTWGYRHRTYDSDTVRESPSFRLYEAGDIEALLQIAAEFDSMEDWPWPLLYKELDARFPDARFVLTMRHSEDAWYRSLCTMAVRIGPFPLYEKTVYGSEMPHGNRKHYLSVYRAHNAAVVAHFAGRPGKLLTLTWGEGEEAQKLADFLELKDVDTQPAHVNKSPSRVYSGDHLLRAHAHRILYQALRARGSLGAKVKGLLRTHIVDRLR